MLFYDTDTVFQEVYPDCYKLLYLLMILSVSVACVDCFFPNFEKSINSNNFGVSFKNRN